MPEITTMPNLSPAPSPASTARATGGTAAPSNNSSVASAPNVSNTPNTPQTAGSAADAGTSPSNAGDSFASVLKRQLAQSAMADLPMPVAALLSDLALLPKPVDALLPDLALLPQPVAALLPDLALLPMPVAAQGADLTAIPEDIATQEIPDDGLPPLSPTLFSITPNIPARLDADLPATEKKPVAAPAGDPLLASAAPTLIPTHMSSAKDTPQAALDKATPETANKTAEFAALLASSADAVPAQASRNESAAGAGTSFENLLAAAQMVSQSRNGEAHSSSHTTTALPIQTPVGAHGWDGEVGDKLVWMVGRQEQRAELVLNPPQLGRVEVTLSMNGDQTSAMFVSTNPAVRDALEAALPRLREILADAGINLGQAQVGADTGKNAANQSANNRENGDNSGLGSSRDDLAPGGDTLHPVGAPQWLKQVNGMVDVFA